MAGGRLYLSNDIGTMLVLQPGREYKELSRNELDEGSGACPIFVDKELYVRGGDSLYRIEAK